MSTNTIKMPSAHEVNAYVTQVRAELADLPPDDVEELTGGLEADLAERVAEAPDGLAGLGSPAAYAAELRSAAGLPAREPSRSGLKGEWTAFVDSLAALRQGNPLVAKAFEVIDQLRPIGWLARGLVLAVVVMTVVGAYWSLWWFAALAAAGSVWLGLRRDRLSESARGLVVVANLVAVVAAVPALASVVQITSRFGSDIPPAVVDRVNYGGPGLTYEGQQVANLFVYDKDGKPLPDVRVFTDRGDPVDLRRDQFDDNGNPLKGPADIYGKDWSNAAPIVTSNGPIRDATWTPPTAIPPLAPTPEPAVTGTATEAVDPSATTGPTGAVPSPTTTRPAPRPTMSTTAPPAPTTTR